MNNEELDKFYKLINDTKKNLKELEKYYICKYCGKFQKGNSRNLKYCSQSCTKKAHREKMLSKMTEEERQQFRENERIRIAEYRKRIRK